MVFENSHLRNYATNIPDALVLVDSFPLISMKFDFIVFFEQLAGPSLLNINIDSNDIKHILNQEINLILLVIVIITDMIQVLDLAIKVNIYAVLLILIWICH